MDLNTAREGAGIGIVRTRSERVPLRRYPFRMTRQRRLRIAIVLNVALVALQVAVGFWAHSLGLIADAGHNVTDVAAIALSLLAVRLTLRPADRKRSFGYHRSTILAAQANSAAILVVTALIGFEAVERLVHPVSVDAALVLPVALIAVVLNLGAAIVLREHGEDLNMRSALLHMAADATASLGVAVAALVILVTDGNDWLDPAISLVIAFVIAARAVQLLTASTNVLLESTPAGLDPDALVAAMRSVVGVDDVHDLHVWSLSSEYRALSAHVVLGGDPSLQETQAICDCVKQVVASRFSIAHATLEAEVEACLPHGDTDCVGPSSDVARATHH